MSNACTGARYEIGREDGAGSSRPIWVQWIWDLALKESLNNIFVYKNEKIKI